MVDFIQKQVEISERLFQVMLDDHKERMKEAALWGEMNASLVKKLEERDRIIAELRETITKMQTKGG